MKKMLHAIMMVLSLSSLFACGVAIADAPPNIQSQAPSVEAIRKVARGFDVGNLASAQQVFVFFDPQCPHCGAFWRESKSLEKTARITWIPVAIINRLSVNQGAAILESAKPANTMNAHEAKLMSRQGGLDAGPASASALTVIAKNTQLLMSFGAEGVPYVVGRNIKTGKVFTSDQGIPAAKLAESLGWAGPTAAATGPAALKR